jgi:hypothetical protein
VSLLLTDQRKTNAINAIKESLLLLQLAVNIAASTIAEIMS